MKIYDIKILFLCGMVGILSACHSDSQKVVENEIRFDSLTVEKIYHIKEIQTNPSCSLQIKFLFPVAYENPTLLKTIQQQFVISFLGEEYAEWSPQEAVNKYVENHFNEYKKQEVDFESDIKSHESEPVEAWYSSREIMNDSILYNQNNLLSFVVYKEYDTGGAPYHIHNYMNRVIDLKTGQRVTEQEIFIEDYQDDLAKIIVDAIALHNNVDEVSDLENIGFFNVNEIYPNKNFYVDEVGITYTFNEYDIAAYVVGVTSVRLSYDKIRHLLRKESPIAHIAF